MSIDFCDDIDLGRKIFKCVSVKDKAVFIFMNLYFLQNNFEKGDKITYHLEKGMGYGVITSNDGDILTIKDNNGSTITLPRMNVNKLDKIHLILKKIQENISNSQPLFKGVNEEDFSLLKDSVGMDEGDWVDFLEEEINQGFSLNFIFDDTFYEDDTNKTVLMKISQRCSPSSFEGKNYIYATYFDLDKKINAIGFDYENKKLISPIDILNTDICELLKIEERHTDSEENNIVQHVDKLQEVFENNKIANNTIYFITLNDFISEKGIDTIYNGRGINCDDISYQLKPVKNRIINKYWPLLSREETKNIIGENETKKTEYDHETNIIKEYNFSNRVIQGSFKDMDEKRLCDNIEIAYFKLNKKETKNNTIDIYKLFLEFKLTEIIPFIKWNGASYDNKYYKIHKDSMIYEGYDILRSQQKTVDINLCQEWTKDFYRGERPLLEELNLFNNLHKTDVLFLKVCSEDNQLIYGTLVIHINGDIEFIIKKNQNDILSITSKGQIKKLIKTCNTIIKTINEQNIYSENNIIDFGKDKEINQIFEKESFNNNIDFLDFNVYYDNNNYEVKKGIKQKEYDENKKKPGFDPLKPPFLLGDRSGLALPLLNKMIGKLPSFFRKIDEIEKQGSLLCHYKKVDNYANRNSLQSTIEVYSNVFSSDISESIINKIRRDFNNEFSIEEITREYQSWQEINARNENRRDLKNIINENGPDIMITNTPSSIVFSVTGLSSFKELGRILLLTKTLMNIYNNYINQNEVLEDNYLKQYFEEDLISLGEITVQKEPPKKKTLQQLFDDSDDDDSSDDSESSDDNLPSSDESDMEGGGGKYDARSYYLKRLKKNDKKLFVFKSEKYQTDKHGNKTNTRYGYPKICQGAKGLGSRQPISVTKEELERINNESNVELGSGKDSYSGAIQVPGREEVDGKEIFYICPQYWDISKDLSIKSEYIEENYTKNDIIPEVLPKDGMTDNFILERRGTYWDGVPRELPHKYIVPGLLDNIIHPDGYPLPCCFSLAKGSNKSGKTIDEKMKEHFQQFEKKDFKKVEKQVKKIVVQTKKEKCTKINTKSIGPLELGKCSQLPIKLQIMLSQDLIFKYDPELSVSNGFIRMGVEQNKGRTIFSVSSFINSYLEIINYKKSSIDFIQEEIINTLENNLELFQECSTIQKLFKKSKITKEDDISYINEILKKNKLFVSINIIKKIKEKLNLIEPNTIVSFKDNKENYFFHLILTLKNYRDFLLSTEEKKDDYIIPILNVLSPQKINVIVFEKIEDSISIKPTEYTLTEDICFVFKDGHYYEPIIYRVNIGTMQEDIKIFSKKKFTTFEHFNKDKFIDHIKSPYPRGRKHNLRSGMKPESVKDINCNDKYCSSWLKYKQYVDINGDPPLKSEIKWISNEDKICENDGEKLYGKIKKINKKDKIIVTESGENVQFKNILIKSNKPIPDPELIKGITQKDNWVWIGGNCKDYDRDIEALIRKEYDPTGDKKLLRLSNETKPNIKKSPYDLNVCLKSNFYIMNKILTDIGKKISQSINQKIIKLSDYEKEDFQIKDIVINNYSEIIYLIAKKKDNPDRIIPINPTNKMYIKMEKKPKIKYSFEKPINFDHILSYNDKYDLKIEQVILNNEGLITCILFTNKTYLAIDPIQMKDKYYSDFEIIESEYNPMMVDQRVYDNGIAMNKKSEYIEDFNKKNIYKKVLFNHLLNIINEKYIDFNVSKELLLDVTPGDKIYFYESTEGITKLTRDEYYYSEHLMFQKISEGKGISKQEIPYFGEIIKNKNKLLIRCSLNDYISKIVKDEIAINQYKVKKIEKVIYSEDGLPNGLSLIKEDIFKIIKSSDFDLLEDYIEYLIDGVKVNNPTFDEKSRSEKYIFISDKNIEDKYDEKLMLEFINKVILNINNGKTLRNMNKLVNDIIKISDIEKNTPDTEVFYKYSKDKDFMYDTLRTIYTKKSDFINMISYEDQEIKKRVQTNKLDNIPFYINKLFGYDTSNIFSIDSKGDDWYGLTNALKQLNISYKPEKRLFIPGVKDNQFISVIVESLKNIIEVDDINNTIEEYNKYNIMRYGKKFEKYQTKEDIIQYWIKNKERKVNIPDIKLLLKYIENKNDDLGVLIVSFNGSGKNYIEFLHTEKYYRDTDVILLQHVKYGNDYVLSNISKQGRLSLTIQELYDISEQHKKWIKEDKLLDRVCIDSEESIRIEREGILESQEEIYYHNDKIATHNDKINKLQEGDCE